MITRPAAERLRLGLMLLFAAIIAGAFTIRLTAIAEPLGIDQSLWASAAKGMANGQRLYHDVWEQRPPGIYWIYVTGFRLFGWTPATVVWLDILAAASTCVLLMLTARTLSGPLTALLTGALYASLTMPAWLYGYGGFLERSVCETFITVCVALGAWSGAQIWRHASMPEGASSANPHAHFLPSGASTGASPLSADGHRVAEIATATSVAAAILGLSAGAAVVLKPNAGLYFPALLLWIALYTRDRWRASRASMMRVYIPALVASAIVPIATFLWLWRLDLLHDARVAVIDFNRFYVSQGFTLGEYAVSFSKAIWLRIKTDPLWLAGIVGSVVAVSQFVRRRQLPPLPGMAVVLGAAAVIVMIVNGARLFNSYFMNPLPALSLMAGWMLGEAGWDTRPRRWVATATLVAMAALLVTRGYGERVFGWARTDFNRLSGHSDETSYLQLFGGYENERGYSARALAELGEYVRQHTQPDERIFLFGISGAGVYFASDRLAAHRFLRVNFFVDTDFPDQQFRLASVLADLSAARPRYLIFERLHGRSPMAQIADNLPNDPAVHALLQSYQLDTEIEDFTLYRRRD
jgi:4-amino-4-deoxy-L-arabinose transferase-like glycosyltransferase